MSRSSEFLLGVSELIIHSGRGGGVFLLIFAFFTTTHRGGNNRNRGATLFCESDGQENIVERPSTGKVAARPLGRGRRGKETRERLNFTIHILIGGL